MECSGIKFSFTGIVDIDSMFPRCSPGALSFPMLYVPVAHLHIDNLCLCSNTNDYCHMNGCFVHFCCCHSCCCSFFVCCFCFVVGTIDFRFDFDLNCFGNFVHFVVKTDYLKNFYQIYFGCYFCLNACVGFQVSNCQFL